MKDGVAPIKEYSDDGGFDLVFPKDCRCDGVAKVGMKIKILLPNGWTGLIRSRSSAFIKGAHVSGTIDRYTGEIFLNIHNMTQAPFKFKRGQSIAQLIPVFTGAGLKWDDFYLKNTSSPKSDVLYKLMTACNQMEVVKKLPETSRGEKGYGSTGRTTDSKDGNKSSRRRS
jgi:dUTPase